MGLKEKKETLDRPVKKAHREVEEIRAVLGHEELMVHQGHLATTENWYF